MLRQETFVADPDLERVDLLGLAGILELDVGIRHRRHPEIAHHVLQGSGTKTAIGFAHEKRRSMDQSVLVSVST